MYVIATSGNLTTNDTCVGTLYFYILLGIEEYVPKVDQIQSCVICEYIVWELENYLENNSTEEDIKVNVENVCPKLPDSVQLECNHFMETHDKALIQLFILKSHGLETKSICQRMEACSPPNEEVGILCNFHQKKAFFPFQCLGK